MTKLFILIQTFQLTKGKNTSIPTDGRYAFGMDLDRFECFDKSDLLTPLGSSIRIGQTN